MANRVLDAADHEGIAALSIILSVLVFAALAAILYLKTRDKLVDERKARAQETDALQARVDRAERFLASDRQILIAWPSDGSPADVECGSFAVIDAPSEPGEILDFAGWMDSESATRLNAAVNGLRKDGTVFEMVSGTNGGATLEVSGLISGSHALLRLREATNLRHELRHLRSAAADSARDANALKAAADKAEFPVWVRDDAGRLVWVNRAFAEQSGSRSPEDAVAENAEFAETGMLKAMAAARQDWQPFSDVMGLADGDSLLVRELPIRDGFAGLAMPGSAAARQSGNAAKGLATALDHLKTGIARFDGKGRLVFFNEAFCALWSWDREWLDTAPDEKAVLDRMRSESQLPEIGDYRNWRDELVDQDGQTVKVHNWHLPNNRMLNVVTVPQADGSRTFLFDNLTESRELETRVVALSQMQRETLDSLSEGIVVFGSNGRIRLSNPQFREMWALDMSAVAPGVHIDALVLRCQMVGGERDDWANLKNVVTGFSDNRSAVSQIMPLADGRIFQMASVPLPDGGTLVVFTDISDAQRIERALRERNEALEQAAYIRNSFVGKVSYELRQPLQNIIGFAQVLSQPELAGGPQQQQEYAGHILGESSELLLIVNNILDLASIDAGTIEIDPKPLALKAAVNDVVTTLGERLRKQSVDIQIDVQDELPDIVADPERLRQILFNLMSNAVGFSPDGAIVKVRAELDDDVLTFSVSDRGPGIPSDVLDHVFDRFESRASGTDHRGAGLGLALVKSFVDLHHGRVWIESGEHGGTQVFCQLPQKGAKLPPRESEATKGSKVESQAAGNQAPAE
ncbi:MAG: ATP-binding protein [Pseudomonadota bacterium]